ncbi:MAG: alpha/beta hydrolase [Verrucomicrobiota bacterium]
MQGLVLALLLAAGGVGTQAAAAPAIIKNLAYVPHGHERQKLDLFSPPNVTGEAPLLVWIHGGAWTEGSKENCPAVGLVEKGWVVASLNYRFSQHAVFPAQLEDCKAALRFLRAHAADYHIDKTRVVVWGASAGGHLVALLGVTGKTRDFDVGENLEQSSAVSCVIDWFGPTDFLHWGAGSVIKPQNKDDVVARLFGGPVADHLELAKKGSPITWVSKDSAPILIMHGDKDPLVPLQQSQTFAAALGKAGVPCTLQVYPGQGHGGPSFNDDAARKLMTEFVEKNLPPPVAK